MNAALPESVGRIVPTTETPPVPAPWLVEGLIRTQEVTAIAVPNSTTRTLLGVSLIGALLESQKPVGAVLDRAVVQRVSSVLVVSTSRRATWAYRSATQGDERVTVVHLLPSPADDAEYWGSLYHLANEMDAGLIVADTVQDFSCRPGTSISLERFQRSLIALYQGNEKSMGVGGEHLWSAAYRKFYLDVKTNLMHPVDGYGGSEPWLVEISAPARPVQLSGEAEQVRQTAELARLNITDRDRARALGWLIDNQPTALAVIWQRTPSLATILPALGRHERVWSATFDGVPIPPVDTGEPGY